MKKISQSTRSDKKFCSNSCAVTFNNRIRNYDSSKSPRKKVNCKNCNVELKIHPHSSANNCLCENCTIEKAKREKISRVWFNNTSYTACKCCGQYKCKNKICKWFKSGGEKTSVKLGIIFSNKGTSEIFDEIMKVRDIYVDMYHVKGMSLPEIQKETGIFLRSIQTVFALFQIKSRNLSDSVSLAKIRQPENIHPKIIKHLTWDGKEVMLRSNNELEIAKDLDSKKIEYKVESFKIPYINKNGESANYIPDFYIPSENLIIEAKGSYFRDEENDKLKASAARNVGYKYKYILDYVETEI